MSSSEYILFMTHDGYIAQDSAFAREIMRRRRIESVAVVHGPRNREMAERTGAFARVIDLVADFRPGGGAAALAKNLARLAEIEKATGDSTIMQDVYQDRWLYGRFDLEFIAAYLCHAADVLQPLCSGAVRAVIGEMTMAAYRLARRLAAGRAPFWFPLTARFFPRFYFENSLLLEWRRCQRTYDEFLAHGTPAELERLVAPILDGVVTADAQPAMFKHVKQDAAAGTEPVYRKLSLHHLEAFANYWKDAFAGYGRNPRVLDHPVSQLPPQKVARWIEQRRQTAWFRRKALDSVPPGVKFASYFLHYQPEYTVEGVGYPFSDQLALIRLVAQSLPAGMLLLVKEQPFMLGLRPPGYYERLLQMPNVRLVSDRANGRALVRNSSLVTTISGTSAMEAMMFGVPAIVFSRVVHSHFKGILRMENVYETSDAIRDLLNGRAERAERSDCIAALAAIHAQSHPGELASLVIPASHTSRQENAVRLGDALERELEHIHDSAPEAGREPRHGN